MSDTITITVPIQVKESDLQDILTTALEGGINYWVDRCSATVRDNDLNVVSTRIFWEKHSDTDTGTATLDAHIIGIGVGRILTGQVQVRDDLRNQVSTLLGGDPDIDADAADCVVQAALFGELVYG